MKFDWDVQKAKVNLSKHSVGFEEAETIFYDFLSITVADPLHSINEERLITIGMSSKKHLLIVVHTDKDDTVRIINSRLATKFERIIYEEER
jgi:uncharacterized DUF497 family protein